MFVGFWFVVACGVDKWVNRVEFTVHSSLWILCWWRACENTLQRQHCEWYCYLSHSPFFHFFFFSSLLSWWKYEIQMKENFGAIHSNLKFNLLLFIICLVWWNRFLNMQFDVGFFGRYICQNRIESIRWINN